MSPDFWTAAQLYVLCSSQSVWGHGRCQYQKIAPITADIKGFEISAQLPGRVVSPLPNGEGGRPPTSGLSFSARPPDSGSGVKCFPSFHLLFFTSAGALLLPPLLFALSPQSSRSSLSGGCRPAFYFLYFVIYHSPECSRPPVAQWAGGGGIAALPEGEE